MVRIQNRGAQELTSCVITYGIRGQAFHTYNWTGSLKHMEYENIWLPFGTEASEWFPATGNQYFEAYAGKPNGQTDENGLNGFALTSFEAAPTFPGKMSFYLKTNNAANETHWTLKDVNDSVLYSGDNLTNNTVYNIPFDLDPGCYVLSVKDRDKDGLSFFANNDGSGIVRLIGDAGTNFFKNLQANFGTELRQEFTVGYSIGSNELKTDELVFDLYPNPATTEIVLVLPQELENGSELIVNDLSGRTLMKVDIKTTDSKLYTLDISGLKPGQYLVELVSGNSRSVRKLLIQ
jgi:hypothetical protein